MKWEGWKKWWRAYWGVGWKKWDEDWDNAKKAEDKAWRTRTLIAVLLLYIVRPFIANSDFFAGTETTYIVEAHGTMAGSVTCKTQYFTRTCTWMGSDFTATIEGDKLQVKDVRSVDVPPEFRILLVSPPKRHEQ